LGKRRGSTSCCRRSSRRNTCPPSTAVAAASNLSPEVQKQVAAGKKWSKSTIAAEQAKRKRTGVAPLNDAEISALLGEAAAPAAAAPAAAAPVAAASATAAPVAARPAAASQGIAVNTGTSVARTGDSIRYVGTPAVGTSKAAKAGGVAAVGPEDNEVNQQRRRFCLGDDRGISYRVVPGFLPLLSAAHVV